MINVVMETEVSELIYHLDLEDVFTLLQFSFACFALFHIIVSKSWPSKRVVGVNYFSIVYCT